MDDRELARVRNRLDLFATEVFGALPRIDQRATAARYLHGLILDTGRKTMRLMAKHAEVDYQRFQQFVTSSPWDPGPSAALLARRSVTLVEPAAWVVTCWSQRKTGRSSVCVARQRTCDGEGVANCQLTMSIWAVGADGCAPLSWRLFIPRMWDDRCAPSDSARRVAAQRRRSCGLPDDARHHPRWRLVLDMLDELREVGCRPPLVAYDCRDRFPSELAAGFNQRGIPFRVGRVGWSADAGGLSASLDSGLAMLHRLGLNDFEGRSWRGWHHHVTLVVAAYAFELSLQIGERRRDDAPHPGEERRFQEGSGVGRLLQRLPRLSPAVSRALPDGHLLSAPALRTGPGVGADESLLEADHRDATA